MAAVTKDFDAIRQERFRLHKQSTFKLGGETFKMRTRVRPDLIASAEAIGDEDTAAQTLAAIDETILMFIDPANRGHERYRKVRASDTDPVVLQDMLDVMKWLVEEYTARPTSPPSPSSASPKKPPTGTPSTRRSRAKA